MFVNDSWSSRVTGNLRASLHSYNANPEGESSQRSSLSRPSGKTIYMQRKEYAESMCKQPNSFQCRVEHLLTVDLDGKELSGMDDCVNKLKGLDAQARVWAQEMILEVQGAHLLLVDIETKEELEAVALASVSQVQAVLDSCSYNSLLLLAVQERGWPVRVFMFQCEEMGAETIRDNLERVVQHRKEEATENLRRNQHSIRSNLETIIGQESRGRIQNLRPPQKQPDRDIPFPDHPPPHWNHPDDQSSSFHSAPVSPRKPEACPPLTHTDVKRDVEIFNHVIDDIEHFMAKLSAATTPHKGKKKGKKPKEERPARNEFALCLQKFKYGFNLLGRVNGHISNPSAEDFVHILFSSLRFVVSHCPPDLPHSVLSPLPTEPALQLMKQVVTPEENKLWQSLGDAWNIPRSRWPNGDMVPPYKPVFYDGWEPSSPAQHTPSYQPISHSNSQPYQDERPSQFLPVQSCGPWDTSPSQGPAPYMRVTYDFMARNSQELSVMKGDLVQVLDQSKQWWKVRSIQNNEGFVPPNVLQPLEQDRHPEQPQGPRSAPPINRMSQPEDVRAWLEYKGFSKITVRSLGVLTGSQVLALTHNELKAICPEEGARVFFQLQGVKSALALASESGLDPYSRP